MKKPVEAEAVAQTFSSPFLSCRSDNRGGWSKPRKALFLSSISSAETACAERRGPKLVSQTIRIWTASAVALPAAMELTMTIVFPRLRAPFFVKAAMALSIVLSGFV